MKRWLLSACLLGAASVAEADIEWLATDYDFGTWHEQQGIRTGFVRFVNRGPGEVAIVSVRPSCGCTGVEYVTDPIQPGDTATLRFSYDPTHRAGRFEKTIKVYTDPDHVLQVITIRGTVIGTPATLSSSFPIADGDVRLSATEFDFGKIPGGNSAHGYIAGYNQSAKMIYPAVSCAKGPLGVRLAKDSVPPGEMFTIGFFLTASNLLVGAHVWPVTFTCGDTRMSIDVYADIEPKRPVLDSASMAVAPRIELPGAPVELTGGKAGGKVKFKVPVTNTGASPLTLYRVYSRAGAVSVTKSPRTVAPGKRAWVEGNVDLRQVDGPAFGYILEFITSDPNLPTATLRLTGQIAR